MKIIKSRKKSIGIVNYITEYIDINSAYHNISDFYHYIYDNPLKTNDNEIIYPIRYPGYTMGCIVLDENNIIKEIKISADYFSKCYKENLENELQQFIDYKLIL